MAASKGWVGFVFILAILASFALVAPFLQQVPKGLNHFRISV